MSRNLRKVSAFEARLLFEEKAECPEATVLQLEDVLIQLGQAQRLRAFREVTAICNLIARGHLQRFLVGLSQDEWEIDQVFLAHELVRIPTHELVHAHALGVEVALNSISRLQIGNKRLFINKSRAYGREDSA